MSEMRPARRRLNLISLLLRCGLLALFSAAAAFGWQLYQRGQAAVEKAAGPGHERTSSPDPGDERPVTAAPVSADDASPQVPPADPWLTSGGETAVRGELPADGESASARLGARPADAESPEPGQLQHLIPGTWEDDYQGKRTMTLRPDGTGTMVVELKGWNAKLFAARLTFEMEWSLDGDRLNKRTIGGEPAGKVRAVLAMMGDRVEEQIIELTDQRLLVSDGERQYDWRRVTE